MSIASQLMSMMYQLPAAEFGVQVEHDISIKAKDGVELLTDVYFPKNPGKEQDKRSENGTHDYGADGSKSHDYGYPTLLMRTPYGRFGFGMVAEAYAERGFITVLQACRGTDNSGGVFDPLINERMDGLATLDWIYQQKWFDGRLGLTGPSYLGYAQWAICDALPEGAALSAKATASNFKDIVFPGGAFALQLWLSWLQTIHGLDHELFGMTLRMATGDVERRTEKSALTLPLSKADMDAVGEEIPFWQQWFGDAIDNPPFWKARDHSSRLNKKTPPNCFVTGWYDLMVDAHLKDYQRLVALGSTPHLTIGPWFHTDSDLQGECLKQTIAFMDAHLLQKKNSLRSMPVKFYVSGTEEWHECLTFPPAVAKERTLFLTPSKQLLLAPVNQGNTARYIYDPSNPTPNVGGAIFAFLGAGAQDNKHLETRPDVLIFTSVPVEKNLTIVGNIKVKIFVKSSLQNTDFFTRICDVDKNGVSINICDAIIRLTPDKVTPDDMGVMEIELLLHTTAHTFLGGHCIRLQISSGAHPRFARNLGTNEPIGSATKMQTAQQELFFGSNYPSSITLPIMDLEQASGINPVK